MKRLLYACFHHPHGSRWFQWLVPAALLLLWQILAQKGLIDTQRFPSPASIAEAAVRLAGNGELLAHVCISTKRAFTGFAIGGGIGFVLGLANGLSRISEVLLDSSLQMVRNLPHLAMVPLVILWFGIGEEAKIFLVALGVLFPIYLNTYHGIRSIDPALIEMAGVYGLTFGQLLLHVILPGALPTILLGVRYALGFMWLTLIVAETISSTSGIGYMAMNAREFLQTDVVLLSILLYALLGKLADSAARLLERLLLPWHHTQLAARRRAPLSTP